MEASSTKEAGMELGAIEATGWAVVEVVVVTVVMVVLV